MTNEEAIEILQEKRDYAQFPTYVKEAIKIATSAIEKQIPKKPKRDKEYPLGRVCPKCHDYLGNVQFITHHCNYCNNCGQALDWSDTE